MTNDIDQAMRNWPFKPGEIVARQVVAADARTVLQLRIDMGVIQMETTDRPDGTRPHGYPTYLQYLRNVMDDYDDTQLLTETMTPEQCAEADREFIQYYQRRLCWLALGQYKQAVADADHNLAFMDFVQRHSPNERYTASHEQYRGFVLFHRFQAVAALELQLGRPERAIDALRTGIRGIEQALEGQTPTGQPAANEMLDKLRTEEQHLRERHDIDKTLHEQLDEAVANENYERAANIRDRIRAREQDHPSEGSA